MSATDDKFRALAVRLLQKGQAASFVRLGAGGYDVSTSRVTQAETRVPVTTFKASPDTVTNPQSILLKAGSFHASEALFFLAASEVGAEPKANDRVELDGDSSVWTITAVESISSGTQDALYVVRAGK